MGSIVGPHYMFPDMYATNQLCPQVPPLAQQTSVHSYPSSFFILTAVFAGYQLR
jgi:hypothetical protein